MNSCTEWIGLASDIAVAVAAGLGAFVAWKGLGAWRQQLKGSNEYDLARRLLKSTYQIRDALAAARSPAMFGGEMPRPNIDEVGGMSEEQVRFFGMSGAYSERFRVVQEHRRALQADLLEAEALWGTRLKPLYQPLFRLQHDVWMAIHTYLRSIDPSLPSNSREAFGRLFYDKHDSVLYDVSEGDDKPDAYTTNVLLAITAIEEELRPQLARA
jgi:hypothetical protein